MTMRGIFILLICISICGCNKQQATLININKDNVTDLESAAEWDKLIDSWEYAALETNDSSHLEAIDGCYIYGDYLFVKDAKDGESRIMQFKLSGDFMHKVGKQGVGEKEYENLGMVWVDLKKRHINIHSGFSTQKRVTYDLDGNFVSNGKAHSVAFYTRQIFPLSEGIHIGFCACGLNNKVHYFTTDHTFNKLDTLRKHTFSFPMGFIDFSTHPIAIYQNRVSCVVPLCDTIFEYANGKLIPRFITTVHRSAPANYQPTTSDYWSQLDKLQKEGYYSKNDIYETKDWFIITYDKGKLFWEKEKHKGYYIPRELPARGDMIYPNDLWGQQNEKLIAIYTPEELQAIEAELKANKVPLSDKMKDLFCKVKTGENPWLFFYHLKKY